MKLRLFNYSKGEVLYNNKKNQSFGKDYYIKKGFKNFSIKFFGFIIYLILIIKLF